MATIEPIATSVQESLNYKEESLNYQEEYDNLIQFRRDNPLEKTEELYTEVHHIKPKCFFKKGTSNKIVNHPDNLVRITGGEHSLAHYYFYKKFNEGSKERKLALESFNAMPIKNAMMDRNRFEYANLYQEAKEEYNKILEQEGLYKITKIIEFYKIHDRYPRVSDEGDEIYKLSQFLCSARQAKKGEGSMLFRKSYQELADESNHNDMFIVRDSEYYEKKTLKTIKQIIDFIKTNNRMPKSSKEENPLILKLLSLRSAKKGLTSTIFHQSFQELADDENMSDLFDAVSDDESLERKGLVKIENIVKFILDNYREPTTSINSEKSMAKDLSRLRSAKHGIGMTKWCDSYQEKATELNMPHLFNNIEENTLIVIQQICEFCIKNKKSPSSVSLDEYELKLSYELSRLKVMKKQKKKNKGAWKESYLQKAIDLGCSNLFLTAEEKAHNTIREIINFIKKYKQPPSHSKNNYISNDVVYELKLAKRLNKFKMAKNNKKGGVKWYHSYQTLATELGYPNLFNVTK